jgi:hypothetical protein
VRLRRELTPLGRLAIVVLGIVSTGFFLQYFAAPAEPVRKSKGPGVRAALAAHYVGMSEGELVAELGPPKRVNSGTAIDGYSFKELIYGDAKWAETDFTIYEEDGVVSEGEVNGVSFETPGFEAASGRCADLWPADVARWKTCVAPYRAKPKTKAREGG